MIAAPATRPALLKFRENWITEGGLNRGLDLNLCTVNGGQCEHPDQLKYCGKAESHEPNLILVMIVSMCLHYNQ